MTADARPDAGGTNTPPIVATEIVVRQIPEGRGQPLFFDTTRATPPIVHSSLFLPSRSDVDGLSLIRLRHRAEVWAAFRAETPDQLYRLARLLPSVLNDCARAAGIELLNFTPSPDALDHEHGEPWAHCVAAEINRVAYDDRADPDAKKRIKTWAAKVSTLVALEDVTGPYPRPEPALDRYRPEST